MKTSRLSRLIWSFSLTQRGFTLIEIIVAIAIASTLLAVSVPSGFNFWARIQLEEAQDRLYAAIRTARSNARTSLRGSSWVVRADISGSIPALRIEDVDGLCNEATIPCQTILLNNSVEIDAGFGLGTNTVIFSPKGEASRLGTYRIRSTFNTNLDEACVTVSTLLGSIRKSC